MKFEHQLRCNSIDEWRPYYINYSALKRIVYHNLGAIELGLRQKTSLNAPEQWHDTETGGLGTTGSGPYSPGSPHRSELSAPLLTSAFSGSLDPQAQATAREQLRTEFLDACDNELKRVVDFYVAKHAELLDKCNKIAKDITQEEKRSSRSAASVVGRHSDAGVDAVGAMSNLSPSMKESYATRLRDLYLQVNDLIQFGRVNYEGFRKICKKFDKEHQETTKETFMSSRPTLKQLTGNNEQALERALDSLVAEYAKVSCQGNREAAKVQLTSAQKEHYEYERRTVFQDMMAVEIRTQGAHLKLPLTPAELHAKWRVKGAKCVLFLGAFMTILLLPSSMFAAREQQNCAAILTFAGLMWATEAVPLHATAVTIPFLVVVLRVLRDPAGHRMAAPQAADRVFSVMFSQVIFLLLGSFMLASALSKHNIARRLATGALSRVGTHPSVVLIAIMFAATILSTFMSNVTAPTLCYGILHPILRYVKSDEPLGKALVMGVAMASNLGGMMSPISSPQNAFAVELMRKEKGGAPSWQGWFAVAIPVAFAGVFACWLLIILAYRPAAEGRRVKQLPQVHDPINVKQLFVSIVTLLTITLWCLNTQLQSYFGNMGVIAIIPMAAFIGFGMLNKSDVRAISWDIILLAQGGLALGEAVKSSGLLHTIAHSIAQLVTGFNEWEVLVVFCALVLVFTSFISHTVGAMIVLPVLQDIGHAMPGGRPNLLIMGAALMCSGAMGFPMSGFPNMAGKSLGDERGLSYLQPTDFYLVGVPSSVAAYSIIVTLGYWLMRLTGY